MKRIGNLLDEIVERNNLTEAFDYIMRYKRRQNSRGGKWLMRNRETVIDLLEREIREGTFTIHSVHEFSVYEHGKERTIHSIPLRQRMVLNAVMGVVEKHILPTYIADTAASIKGRGMHYLHERFRKNMLNDPCGTRYTYKCDIRKFYESIPQDKMWYVTRKYIKDKAVLKILKKCIFFLPKGMSIGLRASQCLANLYLSHYVDHEMKERNRVRYYYRYCDDIIIQAPSQSELTGFVKELRKCVGNAGLEIKPNEQFFETRKRPVDYLGYLTSADGNIRLRKAIKQRFARRWRKVKSKKRRTELIGSFYGVAKHAKARHLFKKITNIDMNTFAQLGLRYADSQGRQFFDVPYTPISELLNIKIVMEDVIPNCETKHGMRHIVRYHSDEGEGKFMTASEELRFYLDEMKGQGLFPVETTIVRRNLGGGKYKYLFT